MKKQSNLRKSRYSAELLFQFRVVIDGESPSKLRLCEDRIIHFWDRSPETAYETARATGLKAQTKYKNDEGNWVHFEFIGIRELIDLTVFSETEVWFSIRRRLLPMERREQLIPPREELSVFNE